MIIEIKIPSPGESINEVEIASWLVSDGDYVKKDQEIAEIESDKATLPLIAEESGVISIKAEPATPIEVGSVACTIDTSADNSDSGSDGKKESEPETKSEVKSDAKTKATSDNSADSKSEIEKDGDIKTESKEGRSGKSEQSETGIGKEIKNKKSESEKEDLSKVKVSPLAKKIMEEQNLGLEDILSGLKRITKKDIEYSLSKKVSVSREVKRERMSMLRRNLSTRLVAVKNETAMLTTFNEVDMSTIIDIRKKYQNIFVEKHGVKVGFMSFFTKAVTVALNHFPKVNSYIDGEDVITPDYCDIGIAVQTDKGLMVPVIRNAESLSLAEIEKEILQLAEKARKNRISIDDMTGGTFTITNGGVFGSLLSTPILNPPQSGILGMHNIVERAVVINSKVEVRPMMYIALSYDHRIIDGRDSVGFLVKIKELLEDPSKMIFNGSSANQFLLDLD